MSVFRLTIKDKDGSFYRRYTVDSLREMFQRSRTAAVFELVNIIESLTFLTYRLLCRQNNQEKVYDSFQKDKKQGTFYNAIEKIKVMAGNDITKKLHNFRDKRNDLVHNWLFMKDLSADLRNYSYDGALEELFNLGLPLFKDLLEIINKFPRHVIVIKKIKKAKKEKTIL